MTLEDLLPTVEKPSRYLGREVNARRPRNRGGALRFALAFPDTYEVGMSHLGLQILYAVLNAHPDVQAERVFAPWPDMEQRLRAHGLSLASLESRAPLSSFDVVGFSLQYELSFTNILNMLELGRIPLRREERTADHPLVVAGGPCAFNPLPLAPFVDAFLLGEGEEAATEIAEAVLAARNTPLRRQAALEALASLPGVYVPAVHGTEPSVPLRKRVVADLDAWPCPLAPIVPLMQTIHDRATVEIARGCSRGCRFCQAGMVWRPVRERKPGAVLALADAMLAATGHDEISLLSLSSGDYAQIEPLLGALAARYTRERVALALPSLRVETLTPALISGIRQVRKTSFTLAPEAGTERLRNIINKGNTEAQLLSTAEAVFAAGWRSLKLYFMVGLPGETPEDVEAIAGLSRQVLRLARGGGRVTVSVSTFVPKPHTPFQWERQLSPAEIRERQDLLRTRLRHRNLSFKWHDGHMSLLEGILSRGEEQAGNLIAEAFRLGCRFDGWADRFRVDLWEEAFRRAGVRPEEALRERSPDAPLPWDAFDAGVTKAFLREEAERARRGEATPDCRDGACHGCGACDPPAVRIVEAGADLSGPPERRREPPAPVERRLRALFRKEGPARFLSHLEVSAAFLRALRRAGVPLSFSEGFHPHPKVSFAWATSVGMESRGEYVDVLVRSVRPLEEAALAGRINACLPEGLAVASLEEIPLFAPALGTRIAGFSYAMDLAPLESAPGADLALPALAHRIQTFLAAASFVVSRRKEHRTVTREIRPLVSALALDEEAREVRCTLHAGPEGSVRPLEILVDVLGLPEETARRLPVVKTATHWKRS